MGKKDDLINYRSFPKEDELYEKDKKSLKVAYILASLPPLMPFGMHKHYLGEHKKGILYCLAWMLTGIGGFIWFLVDMVTMRNEVKKKNYQIEIHNQIVRNYLNDLQVDPNKINKQLSGSQDIDDRILNLARSNFGKLTATQIALNTELTLEEAERVLKKLCETNHISLDIVGDEVIYDFNKLLNEL
jgi:TM2 domain-containing membrane protein YozV